MDRGTAVFFDVDSGLYLSYVRILGPKRKLDHRFFSSVSWYVEEFIQIISFSNEASFNVRCETNWNNLYRVIAIKHAAFFTIWVKLTVAFTCTSLPRTLHVDQSRSSKT